MKSAYTKVVFALTAICLIESAAAVTIGFSTPEGYSNGSIGNHPNWATNGTSTVNTASSATASVPPYKESTYQNGFAIVSGYVYRSSIDFSFTEAADAIATNSATKDLVNLSYSASPSPGNMLKVGFRRDYPNFNLTLQTDWKYSDSIPTFTGGSSISGAITPGSIGVARDADLNSDLLRIEVELTRGLNDNDWSLYARLLNVSTASPVQVAELTASGITFVTSGTLYTGFGGGQNDSNSGASNRVVDTISYEFTDNSPPVLDPPPVGPVPADLNQNGIPDLAELLSPAIAQYPPATDSDGDGRSNIEEVSAGTDPFDATSVFGSSNLSFTAGPPQNIDFSFSSVAQVRYQIQYTESLASDDWSNLSQVVATDELTTFPIPAATVSHDPDRYFFRALVVPSPDTDSDGLEDSLELYLGYDPTSASSVRASAEGGDYTQFFRMMTGASTDGGVLHLGTPGIPSHEQASRFLSQAAFGANDLMISQLRALGDNAYEKWIDNQLSLSPTLFQPYVDYLETRLAADSTYPESNFNNPNLPHYVTKNGDLYIQNIRTAWVRQALFAPDALRQRVAWALSQILVIGNNNTRYGKASSVGYDLILNGAFGNYSDLVYQISINPYMGRYLSSVGNLKADPTINRMPDENYAREIMQLFTIGLWELDVDGTRRLDIEGDAIPTYTNDDIVQVARVFTGLAYDKTGVSGFSQWIATHPMQMNENDHDTGDSVSVTVYGNAEKTFLQSPFYTPASLPAFGSSGRSGLDDIQDTVNILVNHPTCPPFIVKNLIQHLVTSNPSPEYVARVVSVFINDGTGARGNIGAVVKAILLDDEARSLSLTMGNNSGRLKGPMLRSLSLARAFDAGSPTPALHDDTGIQFWEPGATDVFSDFAEYPFSYPSVFNFYEHGYARQGEILDSGLISPEFQILNSQTAVGMPNRFLSFIQSGFHTETAGNTPDFKLILSDWTGIATNTDELLDRLNLLMCHGGLGSASRKTISDTLIAQQSSLSNTELVELAIYLVMTTSEAAILR